MRFPLLAIGLVFCFPSDPDDAITVRGKVLQVERLDLEKDGALAAVDVKHDKGKMRLVISRRTKIEKSVGDKVEACEIGELVDKGMGKSVEADYNPVVSGRNPPVALTYRLRLVQ